MCRGLHGHLLFLLLLLVSLAIDVHTTWRAWPTEASQAFLHGGGNCTSSWDCSLHGSCDNLVEPGTEGVFFVDVAVVDGADRGAGDVSPKRTRMGQCECFAHYTGSHCSVHVLLLEISLRLEEKKRRDSWKHGSADAAVPAQTHADSISLRRHRHSSRLMARSLAMFFLVFSVGLLLTATHVQELVGMRFLWVFIPILHSHWNTMLLSIPSRVVAEASAHGRIVS
jgi:hypothetical protein